MTKVAVRPPDPDVQIPPGFPSAKLAPCVRKAEQLVQRMRAVGEVVGSVEISPEGAVRVLTPAGMIAASGGE